MGHAPDGHGLCNEVIIIIMWARAWGLESVPSRQWKRTTLRSSARWNAGGGSEVATSCTVTNTHTHTHPPEMVA